MSIIFFISYQIAQLFIFPFFCFYILFRKIKGKPVFGNVFERIGLVPKTKTKNAVWFHAVSVGEVLSLQQIINDFKKKNPEITCYVTAGTLTGKKIAKEKLSADKISYLPYDFLPCMLLAR